MRRTIVAGKRGDQPVDTGFIVFNYVNYPKPRETVSKRWTCPSPSRT